MDMDGLQCIASIKGEQIIPELFPTKPRTSERLIHMYLLRHRESEDLPQLPVS